MMRRIVAILLLCGCLSATAAAAELVNPSDWAVRELNEAAETGLIPASLADKDMNGLVTRAEFAAITVQLYETMSGSTVSTDGIAAFSDSADPATLKAVALGFTNGDGSGRFNPSQSITRQDAATMLTRLYKKLHMQSWTLENDGDRAFLLPLNGVVFFEDHDRIDDWARDAVYFLSKFQVIKGDNHGNFNPHNRDGAFPDNTGTATRQEAILMALRVYTHLASPVWS